MKAILEFDLECEDGLDEGAFECALKGVALWNTVRDLSDHPCFEEILQDNGLDPSSFIDYDATEE